jgi:hypothetical protein
MEDPGHLRQSEFPLQPLHRVRCPTTPVARGLAGTALPPRPWVRELRGAGPGGREKEITPENEPLSESVFEGSSHAQTQS